MKLLMPIRYFYIGQTKITHPDWINYFNRHQFKLIK